ncbi:MAG TPA: Gfo/Idh/MocA family oxidoreductase [Candidatus Aphodoplasma excrementigallinarum]|uniref:Gfo/Idh/MocA family oxidoreductase n=1 Tax=Candidatus Aphodoplasma excrementigallinarum TaxID=2840673 RepID=A0A9D1SZ39_9FIRM|nr:Gfo/Idh/MocA family oxidoreductase [Candidatus Aphodoplasma excrementigallinarum]
MANEDAILNQFKNVADESVAVDASKRLRVGIIGTGWIADAHMEQYKKMPDVDIVAGADLVPGKAEAFFKKHGVEGVKCYPSHKEMLDDESLKLDAVSVCTYNMTHAECTIYALDKGVNVLLEKPMCVTTEEAIEILRAEKRSGKVLSIGFQPRFDPNMQMVKAVVESGVLGQIYYIQTGGGRRRGIPTPFGTTFIEKETGGIGALGDIGCYSLDMVLNAIGYPKPLTVTGYKSDFFGKDPNYCGYPKSKRAEYAKKFGVDDFAAGFIRLEGGIILDFRIAWAMNLDTSGDTIIMGTKASLRIPSTECWNGSIGGPLKIYSEVGGEQVETEIPMKESDVNCFEVKVRSFLDAIKNGGEAPVPASQILYNQAILDGIMKSSELGHEIEIQIPEI